MIVFIPFWSCSMTFTHCYSMQFPRGTLRQGHTWNIQRWQWLCDCFIAHATINWCHGRVLIVHCGGHSCRSQMNFVLWVGNHGSILWAILRPKTKKTGSKWRIDRSLYPHVWIVAICLIFWYEFTCSSSVVSLRLWYFLLLTEAVGVVTDLRLLSCPLLAAYVINWMTLKIFRFSAASIYLLKCTLRLSFFL